MKRLLTFVALAFLVFPLAAAMQAQDRPFDLRKMTHEEAERYRTRRERPDYDPCKYGDPGCHPPTPTYEKAEPPAIAPVPSVPTTAGTPMGDPRDYNLMVSRMQNRFGYGYYDEFFLLAYDRCVTQPQDPRCRMGGLRIEGDRKSIFTKLGQLFTGKEEWISKVDVYIEGPLAKGESNPLPRSIDKMGPASAIDGKRILPLPVGRYRVYVLLVEQNLVLFEETVRIQSKHDTSVWNPKGEPTVLRVDHNRFKYEPLKSELAQMIRKGQSGKGIPAEKLLGASAPVEPEAPPVAPPAAQPSTAKQ